MSDAIAWCHELNHLADFSRFVYFSAMKSQPEAFVSRSLKNLFHICEFSLFRIAAQVEAFDDIGMSLAQI